VYLVNCHRNCW